ncbi:hypothetical protein, partial [Escherichia coli]|uniref:hypothetical protein n=3 Tax=Gammaproteobacteria TaxID=1236 RepID=UPI001BAE6870
AERTDSEGFSQGFLMFGKVNVKGGLTGGWPHFVKPTTFANGGVHSKPSRSGRFAVADGEP